MSLTAAGIGITQGIAIGKAHLLQRGPTEITPRSIPTEAIPAEIEHFRKAVAGAKRRLGGIRRHIPDATRSDIVAFIDTHLLMLDDAALVEAPIDLIREHHHAAEWALQLQRNALVQVFDAMEDPYLRTRKDDVDHVVNQIQEILLGYQKEDNTDLKGKVILAQDLTPADTILLRHQGVVGFVTEFGGPMSHTAILARSLGIPAVIGVHNVTRSFRHGEQVVIDGAQGMVLADVSAEILEYYHRQITTQQKEQQALKQLIGTPAITADGHTLSLMVNIELPEDIENTCALQADGVGLYRTEFLFMNRHDMPDEEEHYQTYRTVVEGLAGIPVTIRTLDLGADKQVDGNCPDPSRPTHCCNPALGLRAIRLCLKEPQIFIPQLRAILRAGVHGPIRIMIPMLSNLQEVRKLKQIINEVKASMRQAGVDFAEDIPLGGMIEVPAAALSADAFAKELDFLSIGTNDLVQYTLAIDRIDDDVTYLFDPLHPAILRLIQMVIDAGRRWDIPVSMCGEMAGESKHIPLLLGLGLREFSMQPGSLLAAKKQLSGLSINTLTRLTSEYMARIDEPEAGQLLIQITRLGHY
ncbi:MAG: phosphoenolpyruvate--protein phosphotransferase [Gammaproteobacteria bacterium]|nr:phosphoenolpyruvate--protein phosphotransferase [Gammaproteobacteria bacterium]